MTANDPGAMDSDSDARFAAAIDEYYRRLNRDGHVDLKRFLAEFDDIREDLQPFLEDAHKVRSLLSSTVTTPPRPAEALPTLRYFGDYELLAEIARGGMGIVYRAKQTSLDRIVAVKMILAGRLASPDDRRRFLQEATAAAKLQHPNIVAIYEVGEHDGQQFYSMEYVAGDNLADLTRGNLCTAPVAAKYVQTIARTLSFIHSQDLLHRDLKPSNVLIENATGTVRITDFGLAKRVDSATVFTSTGQVIGTPSYMSPEQAGGLNDQVGPQSDVYSAGAILYELVTGRPPFRGETPWNTAWQVVHSDVLAPRQLNPAVPRDLETICLKCLQKEISRRYQSAVELADDLGRFLRGEPIQARPVSQFERLWRWCRRNPTLAAISSVSILSLLGLILSLALYARSEEQHASSLSSALETSAERLQNSQARLAAMERDRGLRLCEQGDIDHGCLWLLRSLESVPPAERTLIRSIRLNLGAWQRELCTLQNVYPDQRHGLAFSPDSQRFSTSGNRRTHIYDSRTGGGLYPELSHEFHPLSSVFSADGRSLLLHSNSALKLWTDGADPKEVTTNPPHRHFYGVQMTSDGRVLIAISTPDGIQIEDAFTGKKQEKLLPSDKYDPRQVFISSDGQFAATQPKRGTVILSNLSTGKRVGEAMVHPTPVQHAVFTRNSDKLITAWTEESNDESRQFLQYWDTATGNRTGPVIKGVSSRGNARNIAVSDDSLRVMTAMSYRFGICSSTGELLCEAPCRHGPIRMSGDGSYVAFASPEDEARLFDTGAAAVLGQSMGRVADSLSDLQVSPDGTRILVGNESGARLWSTPLRAMKVVHRDISPANAKMSWLAFSEDGSTLLWRDFRNYTARAWNVQDGQVLGKPMQNKSGMESVAVSPDGRWAAIGAGQNWGDRKTYRSLTLWELATGELMPREIPSHRNQTHAAAFTKNGNRLISVGDSGAIYVFDVEANRTVLGPLQHPGNPALADSRRLGLIVSPNQQLFAVFSAYEDAVSLWKMDSDQPVRILQTAPALHAIAFSPDSNSLVTLGEQIQLWDLNEPESQPKSFASPTTAIQGCFDSAGRRLVVSHDDRSVRIWDVSNGELTASPLQLEEAALRIALIEQGNLLVTVSASGARIWDVATATQIGPALPSMALAAISPDGKSIATAGRDIRIWQVPSEDSRTMDSIRRSLERNTGLTIDAAGTARSLSDGEWLQIRGSERTP